MDLFVELPKTFKLVNCESPKPEFPKLMRYKTLSQKGTLQHCWWECKLIQPLWKIVWRFLKKLKIWTSLVAQWLRVCLPVQGTRVRALVWEDPTCRGATGPVSHNY